MDELNSNPSDQLLIIDSEEEKSSLFILQPLLSDDQHEEYGQYELKTPLCISQIYEEEFFDHFHMNYYGKLEHDGLFLASIRSIPIKTNDIDKKSLSFSSKINNDEDHQLIRAIIRTENNNYDISEIINIKNEENILKILFEKVELSSIHHYELIHHIKANEKIVEYDKYNDDQYTNKVAFIFQRKNQINENEILSNNQMSNEMEKFLNLISERIQLKHFKKYRGDLDIKINQHGIYSYYTKFQNHQIMFNIAPIIPTDQNDQLFIRRKSLIGNALLCIVFQEEEGTLFQPNIILGKVTQVYIIVQPIQINSELYYKIQIWRRSNIKPIVNPSGGIFKPNESFRNYFLKLSNKDNVLKNEFLKKLCQIFYSYSKYKNYSDNSIFIQNSNTTKQTSFKHHHLSFIPKIIEKLTNNHRSLLSSQSTVKSQPASQLRTSVTHQQQDSDQSTEIIASLITNMINFIELNNQILSSTSTINNDEQINKNQNTQIEMNN